MKHSLKVVKDLGRALTQKKEAKQGSFQRVCNLCGLSFSTREHFRVFCDKCRTENEVYLFSEWLPEGSLDEVVPLAGRIAA